MLSVISGVLKANIFDRITLVDSSDTTEYGFSIVRCSMVLSVSRCPGQVLYGCCCCFLFVHFILLLLAMEALLSKEKSDGATKKHKALLLDYLV